MRRNVEQKLIEWKNKKDRKPLILNGARQVGKCIYCVNSVGPTTKMSCM